MKTTHLLLMTLLALPLASALADDEPAYTLFHPVPRDKMRELESDRPGATDTPKTVDAGHYQLEAGLVEYTDRTLGAIDHVLVGAAHEPERQRHAWRLLHRHRDGPRPVQGFRRLRTGL